MDPRNRIEIITLRGTLELTIFWNWFIFQPAGKGPIFAKKKKKHAVNQVDTTTRKPSFISSRVSPVLLNTNTTGLGG